MFQSYKFAFQEAKAINKPIPALANISNSAVWLKNETECMFINKYFIEFIISIYSETVLLRQDMVK